MSNRANQAIESAIAALRAERDQIDETIQALERATSGLGGRKAAGRGAGGATPQRRKPKWSPAARKAAAERMRKYWAARKRKGGASEKK